MNTLDLPSTYVSPDTYNGPKDDRIYLDGDILKRKYNLKRIPSVIKLGDQVYSTHRSVPSNKDMKRYLDFKTGRILVVVLNNS